MRDGGFMQNRGEIRPAAAAAAAALGPGVVTGRETAAFFSQTGSASWLGILCAGIVFGMLCAGLVRARRRTGARSVLRLAAGSRCACGLVLCTAHGAVIAAAGGMMLAWTWRIGLLTMPFHGGGVFGAGAALLIAIALTVLPDGIQMRACVLFLVLALAFEAALAAFGRLPGAAEHYIEAELRLSGDKTAAVLLGGMHACLCACVAANAVLRFAGPGMRPARTGLLAGGFYAAGLSLGNLAIRTRPDFVTALRMPLTALCGGWGKAGFAMAALSVYITSVVTLYAVILPVCDVKL